MTLKEVIYKTQKSFSSDVFNAKICQMGDTVCKIWF